MRVGDGPRYGPFAPQFSPPLCLLLLCLQSSRAVVTFLLAGRGLKGQPVSVGAALAQQLIQRDGGACVVLGGASWARQGVLFTLQ